MPVLIEVVSTVWTLPVAARRSTIDVALEMRRPRSGWRIILAQFQRHVKETLMMDGH